MGQPRGKAHAGSGSEGGDEGQAHAEGDTKSGDTRIRCHLGVSVADEAAGDDEWTGDCGDLLWEH